MAATRGPRSQSSTSASRLEQRQAEVHRRIAELGEQLQNAPGRDTQVLAAWQLDGKGPRPEPTVSAIKADLERLQLEWESFTVAINRVLAERTDHIEKHRTRLAREADDHVEQTHRRYLDLVDQLADARQELRELRRAAVWARLYPAEQSAREVADSSCGARRRPLEAMGATSAVEPGRVLDALRSDASYLADACTPEQRLAIEGRNPRHPPNTEWTNDPAARAARDQAMGEWLTSR